MCVMSSARKVSSWPLLFGSCCVLDSEFADHQQHIVSVCCLLQMAWKSPKPKATKHCTPSVDASVRHHLSLARYLCVLLSWIAHSGLDSVSSRRHRVGQTQHESFHVHSAHGNIACHLGCRVGTSPWDEHKPARSTGRPMNHLQPSAPQNSTAEAPGMDRCYLQVWIRPTFTEA
jgi:hypothetical protein